jgi:hypothetical protein
MLYEIIKKYDLSEIEVLSIVHEWYTMGLYEDILMDEDGDELDEICEQRIDVILKNNYELN